MSVNDDGYKMYISLTEHNTNITYTPLTGNTTQPAAVFSDGDTPWHVDYSGADDSTMDQGQWNNVGLGKFLERPVRIQTLQWSVGSHINASIKPWELFLDHPSVRKKLANYHLLRGKLHIKLTISGNQFMYGRALVSYLPKSEDSYLETMPTAMVNTFLDVARKSVRPHAYIDACASKGCEMVVPFFHDANWLRLTGSAEWRHMGELNLDSLTQLRHANSTSGALTIEIYAWMDEPQLSVATHQTQAGYEGKGDGLISKPASAIAQVAGKLKTITWLKPYATATETVASSIGNIARVFGFSRPAILDKQTTATLFTTGRMAVTDADEAVHKMTVDSKQELSVDPRILGLPPCDEMAIKYVANKEQLYAKFTWNEADATDTALFTSNVTPLLASRPTDRTLFVPAIGHLAMPFVYWRGTLIFRFQVIKCASHRGRLRIVYDPYAVSNTPPSFNEVYSRTVDIAEETDFELAVHWSQSQMFKAHPTGFLPLDAAHSGNGQTVIANGDASNGQFKVFVLNNLTSPNESIAAPVEIAVSVRGGEDFEVSSPTDFIIRNFTYTPSPTYVNQAGEDNTEDTALANDRDIVPESPEELDPIGLHIEDANVFLVHMGERYTSLRALMKRYSRDITYRFTALNTDEPTLTRLKMPIFPLYPGYNKSMALVEVTAPVQVLDKEYNPNGWSFLTWFTPCYAAWRGSIRSKHMVSHTGKGGAAQGATVNVHRSGYGELIRATTATQALQDDPTNSLLNIEANRDNLSGDAIENTNISPCTEVEMPIYSRERYGNARYVDSSTSNFAAGDYLTRGMQAIISHSSDTCYERYVAAGEDYGCYFYVGPPLLYDTFSEKPTGLRYT